MPRLLRTVARTAVIAGTATTVSNRVSRRQGNRWASQEAQEAPPPQEVAPPPPQESQPSDGGCTMVDQLLTGCKPPAPPSPLPVRAGA